MGDIEGMLLEAVEAVVERDDPIRQGADGGR